MTQINLNYKTDGSQMIVRRDDQGRNASVFLSYKTVTIILSAPLFDINRYCTCVRHYYTFITVVLIKAIAYHISGGL